MSMAKSYIPKFQIGQKVVVGDDPEICEVLGFSFDGEEFRYRLSSNEIDMQRRKLIPGVKHSRESEMKLSKAEGKDE